MNKKRSYFVHGLIFLFFLVVSMLGFEQRVCAETIEWKWNKKGEMKYQDGVYTMYAYPHQDKKIAWVHRIEVAEKGTTQPLIIPETIKGRKVTHIGYDMSDTDEDFDALITVFGEVIEPWHALGGSSPKIAKIPELVLPDSVIEIMNGAFSGMKSIQELKLPKSLEYICYGSFYSCKSLKKVIYPKECKEVFEEGLRGCRNLTEFVIPSNNPYMKSKDGIIYNKQGTKVLRVAPTKKEVILEPGVTSIAKGAFVYSKAQSLTIPAAMTSINTSRIQLKYLISIKVDPKNKVFAVDGDTLYERKTKKLVLAIVKNSRCKISDKVKVIPKNAILCGQGYHEWNGKWWSDVVKLEFPKNLKSISISSWEKMKSFDPPVWYYFQTEKPPKLTDLEDTTYYFGKVYMPEGSEALYKKWLDRDELEIEEYKGYVVGKKVKGKNYTYLEGKKHVKILKYHGSQKNVKVPSKIAGKVVTEIGDKAFANTKVQYVTLPETITSLGEATFYKCTQLKSVKLPDNLEMIPRYCFSGCKKLFKINWPSELVYIDQYAFYKSSSFKKIETPEYIEHVGRDAFEK